MLCVNQTLNTMNTQTGPLQSTETSSLVRGDWWWSSWRVQSNYVINFGNCGESLWCSLLLHMISTCVCSTHMYVSHAVCSQILAYTYTCTHIHTIAHFNAPFQHGLSQGLLSRWQLRDTTTGDTDSNSRQNTFKGFYEMRWQSLSVDKLQSVFTGMSDFTAFCSGTCSLLHKAQCHLMQL